MLRSPMVHTEDLRIENITVNNDTIGTFTIEANWDNLYSGLDLNALPRQRTETTARSQRLCSLGEKSPQPMNVNLHIGV